MSSEPLARRDCGPSREERSRGEKWLLLHPVAVLVLGGTLAAVAVFGVRANYRPLDLLAISVIYFLFAEVLHAGVQLAWRWSAALGAVGSWFVSVLVVTHFREQTFLPSGWLGVAVTATVLSPVVWWLERACARHGSLPWGCLAVPVVMLTVLLAASFFFYPGNLRWHLLRHNTLLGVPLYYLLAEPVPALRQEIFVRHPPAESPPAAAMPGTLAAAPAPDDSQTPPHIVFVLIDTLRADALAAWGGDPEVMPWLNHFASSSYRFEDVLVSSSWTRPSIASMFTGLLPEEHGARDIGDPLSSKAVTLAELLQERGYETTAFVSNVAAIGGDIGFEQGFDFYHELSGDPYARAERLQEVAWYWLSERRTAGPPLFLYLHYLDPHEPYLSGAPPKRQLASEYLPAYQNELRYLDAALSGFLPRVRELLGGRTAIFVTSDHGEELFEHELFGHGHSLYDEVVRVPALLDLGRSDGDGAGGGAIESRLQARDFFDLLLSVASVASLSPVDWAVSRHREERYLSLYLTGRGRLWLRPYLRHKTMRAVEVGDRKLIWSGYGDTWELYDRNQDPGELRNLAASDRAAVEQLGERFDAFPRAWFVPERRPLSELTLRQLKALGYVDD